MRRGRADAFTDDTRSAPALELAKALGEAGARVTAYDPRVAPHALGRYRRYFTAIAPTPYDALRRSSLAMRATA